MSASLLDAKFLLLLTFVCVARGLWPTRYYALLGALASGVLIALASLETFVTISLITVLYVFPLHRWTRHLAKQGKEGSAKAFVRAGIAGLVLLLVVFKVYQNFSIPALGGQWLRAEVVSLIGFSYFLFRAIQFLHIQSIADIDEPRPWSLLFFLLFPPTLTSGPIQKFQDFRKQVASPEPLSRDLFWTGAYRVTRGLFRKLCLAAPLNSWVEALMANSTPTLLISISVIVALYLYFYFDFAGYSDIAIGFGYLLGIRVPENFRNPFLATTVTEFWRNWHITLGDWFRDQVFIPLGGMSAKRLYAGTVAFAIMVLCGLWHGLTLGFILWGLWHGSMLLIEAVSGSKPLPPSQRHGWIYWQRVAWTNSRVAVASILFLPNASLIVVLRGFTPWL